MNLGRSALPEQRWFAATVVLGLATYVAVPGLLFALVVAGACAFALKVLCDVLLAGSSAGRAVRRYTSVAFVAHLGVGLVISQSAALQSYLGMDAFYYESNARRVVSHWLQGGPMPTLPAGKEGFVYLLASLYVVFGQRPLIGIVVNCAMAAATIPVLADSTRRMFGDAAAAKVGLLFLALPVFMIWPSQLLREAGIYLLMSVAINAGTRMLERTRPAPVLCLVASLGLLMTFRSYVALILAGGLIAAIALGRRGVGGLAAGGSAAVLLLALALGAGLGYSGLRYIQNTGLEDANISRADLAKTASSGFLPDTDISTAPKALRTLPVTLPLFLLGPAPWVIATVRQLPAAVDTLAWWGMLPSVVRGFKHGWKKRGRGIFLFLAPAAGLSVVLSLVIGNYGTVIRSRAQVLLLLLPVAALGLAERKRNSSVHKQSLPT